MNWRGISHRKEKGMKGVGCRLSLVGMPARLSRALRDGSATSAGSTGEIGGLEGSVRTSRRGDVGLHLGG